MAQTVKNLPAMQKTWVRFLGWDDPLEKGKATTPVFWAKECHGLCSPWGRKELDMTERLSLSLSLCQCKLKSVKETFSLYFVILVEQKLEKNIR